MGNEPSQSRKPPHLEKSISITSRPVLRSPTSDSDIPASVLSPSPPASPHPHDESVSHTVSPPTVKKSKSAPTPHRRRTSSLLVINNGVTNKYVSSRICKISMRFWSESIDTLTHSEKLEIGCSIFCTLLASNEDMKQLMRANSAEKPKIAETSIKYLDMFGWLIRNLVTDGIDLYALLSRLGAMHRSMGIKMTHFNPMLQAMHETFSYYFEQEYTVEVKYAFDEIFAVAAQIMTGQKLKCSAHLLKLSEQFQGDEIPFLQSLDACLSSEIGREYLFRYLAQTWCDEMVIFLQTLSRFKALPSEKERFMVAREIVKTCIRPSATFALNISYENRTNTLYAMKALEQTFTAKEPLSVPVTLFANVEAEVNKLLLDNHWVKFVDGIQVLQSKSFD